MRLSVETQVAAAVAAAFIAMTAIAIGHETGEGQTSVPDAYGVTNNPRINAEVTEQQYNSDLQPTLWVDAIRL